MTTREDRWKERLFGVAPDEPVEELPEDIVERMRLQTGVSGDWHRRLFGRDPEPVEAPVVDMDARRRRKAERDQRITRRLWAGDGDDAA